MKPISRFLLAATMLLSPAFAEKPRLLVLTDIGGDPDDTQSLVRLLVHSDTMDIEGLIASAAGIPGELKERVTKPEIIREVISAYGKIRPNLVKHSAGFPEAEHLLTLVKSGSIHRGPNAIGDGNNSEGSAWIIAAVDKPDPRPLHISIWGGQTDLAQALWKVRKDRTEKELAAFLSKIRIYDIADQDGVQPWIFKNFPDLFYVLNKAQKGKGSRTDVFRGMYLTGDASLTTLQWLEENIRQNHGPLGALYPPKTHTDPSPHRALKEGDTPSWFWIFQNGLSDPAHPEWDSWGGRFTSDDGNLFRDPIGGTDARETVSRWRPAFQNEFAARLDWCATPDFKQANHPPTAVLNGDKTTAILQLKSTPGQDLTLTAQGSTDPDGNELEARWILFPEAGGISASSIDWITEDSIDISYVHTRLHAILALTDSGNPPLTRYRRAVIIPAPEE